jgi:hypothetical protein
MIGIRDLKYRVGTTMKSDVTNWQRMPRLRREEAEMVYAVLHEQSDKQAG